MEGAVIQREQDLRISEAIGRETSRLRSFVGRRVGGEFDVEDILQDVFFELVEAYRLLTPIQQVSAWLFRVAGNKITDLFRKKRPQSLNDAADGELSLEDLLPSPEAGPDAQFARTALIDEIDEALDSLPEEQRSVFIAHEIEGRSFKELAAETGVNVNTLLSRKRAAVLQLRRRLQSIHDEFVNE